MKNQQKYRIQKMEGIAILPVVLIVSGILMELAIAGTVLSTVLNNTAFSQRLSAEALAAARAGAQDAIMKVSRNKDFEALSPGYSLSITDRASAQIIVCKNKKTVATACDTADGGKNEITSVGAALTRSKKIMAVLGMDIETGKVQVISFKEISL